MNMIRCTLTVRAYFSVYEEATTFTQTVKRRAEGTMAVMFDLLPRIGEGLRVPNGTEFTEFTVKGVTYHIGQGNVVHHTLDLGSAMITGEDAFEAGLDRWRATGFTVTVKEHDDAS